ncbi:MAG: helix-turn-helix transcriptional regulator [Clostridium sp.]|uniref:helix-turn-helix domain-containing protein n=1 Tax=Clostridium sp. TaxID=1506 RepID=UPI002FC5E0EF
MSIKHSVLKNARRKAGLTQEELANNIGVSKFTIAKYEQGQREPNLDTLSKIINELDIDFWDIIEDKNIEVEARGIYKKGEEFYKNIIRRVNRRRGAEDWVYDNYLKDIFRETVERGEGYKISNTINDFIEKACKIDSEDMDVLGVYEFNNKHAKLKRKIIDDIVRSLEFTLELKLKEAEETINRKLSHKK